LPTNDTQNVFAVFDAANVVPGLFKKHTVRVKACGITVGDQYVWHSVGCSFRTPHISLNCYFYEVINLFLPYLFPCRLGVVAHALLITIGEITKTPFVPL
jgi:hypothetical protein